jgi:DNA polymerase delta subunit OB-fold domain
MCVYGKEIRYHFSWLVILDVGHPTFVPRVLDVVKSQLCFVIGTIYMDMTMKPNVLEDIGRDVSSFCFYRCVF